MPSFTGELAVALTVRDVERSAAWYVEVLGMFVRYNHPAEDGSTHYVCLGHHVVSVDVCLVRHAAGTGDAFSELHVGLDHLEFLVASREELDRWADRLDQLGVPHSGVKALDYTRNSMLTFRDPDNIQLEFFWRAPAT